MKFSRKLKLNIRPNPIAKKVLIADQVALIADKVFDTNVDTVPCFFAWIGVFAYTLQIYFDFSAYSDMASPITKRRRPIKILLRLFFLFLRSFSMVS